MALAQGKTNGLEKRAQKQTHKNMELDFITKIVT